MSELNLDIRTLRNENIKDAFFLYKKVMHGSFSYEQFYKKYQTEYTGMPQCSQLAYINNSAIGFYGAIPCFVKFADQNYMAVEVCDSFTLSNYRRQKVNYHLAAKCYELIKQHSCSFAFGFQSLGSYSAAKKHDWQVADKMMFRFHVPVKRSILAKYVGKLRNKFSYENLFKNIFSEYINVRSMRNMLEEENGITVDYKSGFLKYKTFTRNHFIEIDEVKYWVNLKTYFEIGAVSYKTAGQLYLSLQKLISLVQKLPVSEIIFNASFNTKLYLDLAAHYEPHPSWIIGYLNFDNKLPVERLLVNPCDFDTY